MIEILKTLIAGVLALVFYFGTPILVLWGLSELISPEFALYTLFTFILLVFVFIVGTIVRGV